jgi:hypothetical protein
VLPSVVSIRDLSFIVTQVAGVVQTPFATRGLATRSQAATEIVRAFRLVDKPLTERQAVAEARRLGIVRGYADGSVRPDQYVSPAELGVMLDRAKRLRRRLDRGN